MAEYAGKLVIFGSEEEVNQAIKQYEEDTIAHFVVGQKLKGFTSTELQVRRLCWYLNSSNEVKVPYDGIPFSYAGKLVMRCHHGPDKCKKQKVKYKETRIRDEATGVRKYGKPRVRKTPLKKVDCPAKISIKKVVKFPEYKLGPGKETEFGKKMASRSVMEALQKDANGVQKEVRYYVKFAAVTDHKNHEMGELAARVEPVDDRVLNALHSYAIAGVRSCAVLQKLGIGFVEDELFKGKAAPPRSRRRFYPSLSDIRNFLYKNKEELSKAHGAVNSQMMSELGADVASTSTAPSGDENIDSAGIVALMNAAVNNHLEKEVTQDSNAVSEGIEQQPVVSVVSASNSQAAAISVQETIPKQTFTQKQTVMQTQTLTQTQQNFTQTHAFTKPITQADIMLTQTPAVVQNQAISNQPAVVTQIPDHYHPATVPIQPQQLSVVQPQQVPSTSLQPQSLPMQVQHQPGLPQHLQEIEIQIPQLDSEIQQIDNPSLQQQVANTLHELAGLPTQTMSATITPPPQALPTKPSRLRLILRMKDLTRQLHDYALLVQDTDNLQRLVTGLEGVVEEASKVAAVKPQKSKTRAKKRKASEIVAMPKMSAAVQNHLASASDTNVSIPVNRQQAMALQPGQEENTVHPVTLHANEGLQNKTYQTL